MNDLVLMRTCNALIRNILSSWNVRREEKIEKKLQALVNLKIDIRGSSDYSFRLSPSIFPTFIHLREQYIRLCGVSLFSFLHSCISRFFSLRLIDFLRPEGVRECGFGLKCSFFSAEF